MYRVYLEYRGCNELMTEVKGLARARALCNQLSQELGDDFIVWCKKIRQ